MPKPYRLCISAMSQISKYIFEYGAAEVCKCFENLQSSPFLLFLSAGSASLPVKKWTRPVKMGEIKSELVRAFQGCPSWNLFWLTKPTPTETVAFPVLQNGHSRTPIKLFLSSPEPVFRTLCVVWMTKTSTKELMSSENRLCFCCTWLQHKNAQDVLIHIPLKVRGWNFSVPHFFNAFYR